MTDFFVDVDAVGELTGRLRGIHDALTSAEGTVAGRADATGSTSVADALRGFESGWSDGRKLIEEEISTLAQAAQGAAEAYAQAEDSIIQNARSGGVTTTAGPR